MNSNPHLRRLKVLYVIVIIIGLIAAKASRDASDATHRNHELIARVEAETRSLAGAQILLERQAHYLCVKLKNGHFVFQKELDALGTTEAARVSLVTCKTP